MEPPVTPPMSAAARTRPCANLKAGYTTSPRASANRAFAGSTPISMKKVAIFRASLLPYSETFIREQARALRRWNPILLGLERLSGGLALADLDVRLLPEPRKGLLNRWGRSLCNRFALPYLSRISALHRIGCRLVHAHFGTDAVEIWPAVRILRLPMLVTLHGYDINIARRWWQTGRAPRLRHYPRRLLTMALHPRVHFIAVSQAIREKAIAFGIPANKLTVNYTGVDTARFRPGSTPISKRPRRILFVGRLVEKKGAAYLIRAFSALRARYPDAELTIAGDGPLRADLECLALQLGVPVTFLGTVPHDEVKQLLDRSRVLCLPSVVAASGDAEGFGMVLLEAQACGVPVVSSALGGSTEGLLHGRSGFRFAEGDTPALEKHLALLLGNDEVLERMSREALAFVRQAFDLRTCTENLEAVYDELTG